MVLSSLPKWNTLSALIASYQSQEHLGAQEGDLCEGKQGACINPTEKGAGLKSQLGEH